MADGHWSTGLSFVRPSYPPSSTLLRTLFPLVFSLDWPSGPPLSPLARCVLFKNLHTDPSALRPSGTSWSVSPLLCTPAITFASRVSEEINGNNVIRIRCHAALFSRSLWRGIGVDIGGPTAVRTALVTNGSHSENATVVRQEESLWSVLCVPLSDDSRVGVPFALSLHQNDETCLSRFGTSSS